MRYPKIMPKDFRYKIHNEAVMNIMFALQPIYKDMRLFRRDNRPVVGLDGKLQKRGRSSNGQADIWCIFKGLHIEIEVKTNTAVQSPSQKKFEKAVSDAGGLYLVYREEGTWNNFGYVRSVLDSVKCTYEDAEIKLMKDEEWN